jgi:hypothetical protein
MILLLVALAWGCGDDEAVVADGEYLSGESSPALSVKVRMKVDRKARQVVFQELPDGVERVVPWRSTKVVTECQTQMGGTDSERLLLDAKSIRLGGHDFQSPQLSPMCATGADVRLESGGDYVLFQPVK